MERHPGAEWIKIRQRREIDGGEYYAERLYETGGGNLLPGR
jgi:hypothetical protein